MPNNIGGLVHIHHYRPGSDFSARHRIRHDYFIINFLRFPCKTRIGSTGTAFRHIRFNDIIFPIKIFISRELNLHLAIFYFLYGENGDILIFFCVQCNTQNDQMYITIYFIHYSYIINFIISIQIEVIDPVILFI